MGTTSEKLTYLNTTKEKIRDSINLTGANLTSEDTFRSYAAKLNKGYIDIINNGTDTLYNNLPKVSEIGSNLSLTPTYEAPMRNLPLGNTQQDGTPTPDTPVEIQSVTGLQNIEVCGKNLFDKNNFDVYKGYFNATEFTDNSSSSTLYIPIENDKTYTIQKISSTRLRACLTNEIPSSSVSINNYVANDTGTNITITNANYKYLCVWYWRSADTLTEQEILDSIQIEVGSTATEYEPYTSNTYEVNLGKNLSRIEDGTATINGLTMTIQDGVITLNGTTTASCVFKLSNGLDTISDSQPNTNWFSENVVDKLAGKVLSINNISGSGPSSSWAIRLFKNTTTYSYQYTPSNFSGDKVYTTGENISCICIFINGNLTFDNYKIQIQLEKGTKSTNFSPYFTPIELNKIGDYQDSIKKSTGKNIWKFDENNLYRLDVNSYNILGNNSVDVTSTSGTWKSVKFLLNVPNGTYTFSVGKVTNSNSSVTNKRMTLSTFTNNGSTRTVVKHINMGTPETITITNETDKIYALEFYSGHDTSLSNTATYEYVQVVSSSTALPYEPYGKVLYIEKNINKKIFNGSNSDGTWAKQTGYYNCNANLGGITGQGYTNYYSYGNLNTENKFFITTNAFRVNDSTDTLENYITWLSTHNIELLYVSNTPTYDTITNEELIEQLDNLYTAKSQEGTTNISITSEYLPMLLSASALKGDA